MGSSSLSLTLVLVPKLLNWMTLVLFDGLNTFDFLCIFLRISQKCSLQLLPF